MLRAIIQPSLWQFLQLGFFPSTQSLELSLQHDGFAHDLQPYRLMLLGSLPLQPEAVIRLESMPCSSMYAATATARFLEIIILYSAAPVESV